MKCSVGDRLGWLYPGGSGAFGKVVSVQRDFVIVWKEESGIREKIQKDQLRPVDWPGWKEGFWTTL